METLFHAGATLSDFDAAKNTAKQCLSLSAQIIQLAKQSHSKVSDDTVALIAKEIYQSQQNLEYACNKSTDTYFAVRSYLEAGELSAVTWHGKNAHTAHNMASTITATLLEICNGTPQKYAKIPKPPTSMIGGYIAREGCVFDFVPADKLKAAVIDTLKQLSKISFEEVRDIESRIDNEWRIGIARYEQNNPTCPRWSHETGELFFGSEVVKKIKNIGYAENVLKILGVFEEEHWPVKIEDPLPGGKNAERLKDTLKSLNRKLTKIAFDRDGSGEGICWKIAE